MLSEMALAPLFSGEASFRFEACLPFKIFTNRLTHHNISLHRSGRKDAEIVYLKVENKKPMRI